MLESIIKLMQYIFASIKYKFAIASTGANFIDNNSNSARLQGATLNKFYCSMRNNP